LVFCDNSFMRTLVKADQLWTGSRLIAAAFVVIEDGLIGAVGSLKSEQEPAAERTIQFDDCLLAPAFFDVHIHGAAGHDGMEATPEAVDAIGGFLAQHGTGSYLATTVTAPLDETLRSLCGLSGIITKWSAGTEAGGRTAQAVARPVGIHLEGPFLSHTKRGVHPPEHLLDADPAIFDRMFEAAEGQIRLLTLAPELPGAVEFTAHAVSRGVRVSVGHSNATAAETLAVIAAGAVSATHTFNAMRPLNQREPGILGIALTRDDLFAELICDGVHVAPEMVKLWWRAKGLERAILVTDAMSATGMPDGIYRLGDFDVEVADGRAMVGGVLAGSVLTLDRALLNFVGYAGASVTDAIRLVTTNPASMTGLGGTVGHVAAGQAANWIAIDATGQRMGSMQDGILLR